jgi:hypothetical protein
VTNHAGGNKARLPRYRRGVPAIRTSSAHPEFDNWLRLASSGWSLQLADVLAEPITAALVSEDAGWYFAVEDWRQRRPQRWRRKAMRQWRAEEVILADKQVRLVEAAIQVPTLPR